MKEQEDIVNPLQNALETALLKATKGNFKRKP